MKHLILLNSQSIMDIIVDFLQWFINYLIKSLQLVLLHMQINPLLKVKLKSEYAALSFFQNNVVTNKLFVLTFTGAKVFTENFHF